MKTIAWKPLMIVKRFQTLLANANSSVQYESFARTQLNGSKYKKWLNFSIWPIDGILTDTNTPGQSGPWSNYNERVLHIP